ncbi:GyrI-like domain-containing protein [Lachnospiraceae bacterium ZAX-1]
MDKKIDFKKEHKDLYLPKKKPTYIEVPQMNFIMVDGKGEPGSDEYQEAMQLLYSISFTIKMSKMKGEQPDGYYEYVVPPLEGLWWCEEGKLDLKKSQSEFLWTSLIRQPEFVTKEVIDWAITESKKKKHDLAYDRLRFSSFTEGKCVQMMHIGPYSEEEATIEEIEKHIVENGLKEDTGNIRKHHEIYLSDPRRTDPLKLRTVIRLPVK